MALQSWRGISRASAYRRIRRGCGALLRLLHRTVRRADQDLGRSPVAAIQCDREPCLDARVDRLCQCDAETSAWISHFQAGTISVNNVGERAHFIGRNELVSARPLAFAVLEALVGRNHSQNPFASAHTYTDSGRGRQHNRAIELRWLRLKKSRSSALPSSGVSTWLAP